MDAVLPDSGRTVTPVTSVLMHRSIETLEIGKLTMQKNKLTQYLDKAEDEESAKGIEAQIKEVDIKLKTMKEHTRERDQQTRKAPLALLTKETMLSQDWHDARYHRALAAGVSHSEAWRKEKGRRTSTRSIGYERKSAGKKKVGRTLDREVPKQNQDCKGLHLGRHGKIGY